MILFYMNNLDNCPNYFWFFILLGYEFFAKRQLVTLFSAPNYCGEFDNAGAMMSVDETLMCSFQILKVCLCSEYFLYLCLSYLSLYIKLFIRTELYEIP